MMRHSHRSWLALALLVLVAALPIGCSKSPAKPRLPTPIPHADADDVVQLIATTLAADHGGWYFLVKAFAESLSVPAPNPVVAGGTLPELRSSVPLASRMGIRNNFQISAPGNPGITWFLQVGYIRFDQTVTTTRDTASQDLVAFMSVDGGQFSNMNGLTGTYGAHSYSLTGGADSTFYVTNLHANAPDTLEFSGFLDDSCFANVHSTISGIDRLWFHLNFVDWNLRIPKSKLVSAPYPVGLESEINWVIEARGLATPGRDDFALDYIIEAHMIFDGTPDATLSLSNVSIDPDWAYYYKVNLNTGLISRIN